MVDVETADYRCVKGPLDGALRAAASGAFRCRFFVFQRAGADALTAVISETARPPFAADARAAFRCLGMYEISPRSPESTWTWTELADWPALAKRSA
jgi:hypothetical protein